MKTIFKTLTGALMLCTASLFAQNGSTPVNGTNPVAPVNNNQNTIQSIPNQPVPLDGNGVLGTVYQFDECGLNYTTATVKLGQRFSPPGVSQPAILPISAFPGGTASIVKAIIWADASGAGSPITINITNPSLSSFSIPMSLVGGDADKCWGYNGSYTYRADVTAAFSGNGNYKVSGFPTGYPDDIDGCTMMVIWQDNAAGFRGHMEIADGAVERSGTSWSQTLSGFTACQGIISNARAFCAIGDLQGFNSQITLNGGGPYTTTEDWWNYVDVPTTVTPGQSSSTFGNSVMYDCYNFCLAGLYWQSNCNTCSDVPCDAKAKFDYDGCNPVSFLGHNSAGAPVISWFWQFGDGSTSTLQNPTHTYAVNGIYTVCLTIVAIGSDGKTCCDQVCQDIQVCDPPPCGVIANFNEYSSATDPMVAIFTDASTVTGPGVICEYKVDFGDGSPTYVGPTPPPTHTYPGPGAYTVCWEVRVCVYDAAGNLIDKCEDKICKTIYIGPQNPNSPFRTNQQPKQSNSTSDISVFPSPTNSTINVTVPDLDKADVKVLNATGQEVAKVKLTGKHTYQADVSQLAPGMYFITVQAPDGTIRKEKFIKE